MNSLKDKVLRVIKNPKKIIIKLASKGLINYPDDKYLKFVFKEKTGKTLNLKNPKTFNEKMQWLKLNDRKKIYSKMVDKCEVKNYVKSLIGEKYIIPTLGVWNSFDEIDFDKLPNEFVLKCNHDSSGAIICTNKQFFDYKTAKKTIEKNLRINYFYNWREWPYKNVKPRILAEKYIQDNVGGGYKFKRLQVFVL